MKRVAAMLFLALVAGRAHAWEAQTTHAGFAEQAALSSRLHRRLVALGFDGGLYEPLTIPPADAPVLLENLKLLSPTHGAVPDARGRQTALAWVAAGASLADMPSKLAANHFYDPTTQKGWSRPSRGLIDRLESRTSVPASGMPAPDWIVAKDNPFNLAQFEDQYAKAVSASTPGERSRHMAAALVAAGAILHVLADMGSPSRVRGDAEAHFDDLGGGHDDRGSRFERIAALAYGRLGIPGPSRVVTRAHLRDYFTNAAGDGLADIVAKSYFSENTLPGPTRTTNDTKLDLVRPLPSVSPNQLKLVAASRDDGATLRDKRDICLARYKVEHGVLAFHEDDDCMLEQINAILPEVAAYETGLLDFLLRGELTLTVANGQITVAGSVGAGSVDVLVEDERGVRTSIGTLQTQANASERVGSADPRSGAEGRRGESIDLGRVNVPASGSRVVAVFRGVDANGESLVAVGGTSLAPR